MTAQNHHSRLFESVNRLWCRCKQRRHGIGGSRSGVGCRRALVRCWTFGAPIHDARLSCPVASLVSDGSIGICEARSQARGSLGFVECSSIAADHGRRLVIPLHPRWFLQQIAECPGMVATLTGLMLSADADLALASLRLINALLRWLEGLVLKEFVDANGVDALEAVCDKASQNNAYGGRHKWQGGGNNASDVYTETAADLIDDLFGDKIEGASSSMDSSPEGTAVPDSFSFIDSKIPQTFDFHEQQLQSPAFPNASSGKAGRGRGRGKAMPAWMQRA
jgi:hypothetical protein